MKTEREIDQSQQSLDFNQNSQAQKPQQQFQHRVCNLIRHTSELKSEIQASFPHTTAPSVPPVQNQPTQSPPTQNPPTKNPPISPVSSPTSSSSPLTLGQPVDRPAFPGSPGLIDGPADYVKNEPSRSLYGRLQSNFPATDFPKTDRSANMFNFGTKIDPEKSLTPLTPKLTAPPKLTRPPMMTDHSRLGLGQLRGRFEMPTLSKYPKFESRDAILEKPFIKLEPDDGEVKEPKIEKTSDDHQARFQSVYRGYSTWS